MGIGFARRCAHRLGVLLLLLGAGCVSSDERPGVPEGDVASTGPTGARSAGGSPDDGEVDELRHCSVPGPGCACDPATDVPVECHSDSVVEDEHGRLRCFVGARSCEDGVWGACAFAGSYALPGPGERAFADLPTPCPNCDPSCYEVGDDYSADPGSLVGLGTGIAWSPGPPAGIVMSAAGSALIGQNIWVAFHATSEVAKIRASDGAQIGRFYVGDAGNTSYPSRTAVDTDANVYIGSRAIDPGGDWFGLDGSGFWGAVTKIAGDPLFCNNAPTPTTSIDDVPLPVGTDDCVMWNVRIGSAQGSHVRGVVVDRNEFPWVAATQNVDGGREPGRIYQLDPATGAVLQSITLPIHPYGAVVDGRDPQRIWVSSHQTGALASVDTTDGSVDGPFYPPTPGIDDDDYHGAYGIAVDSVGRIWRGSYGPADYITRYDPEGNSWCHLRTASDTAGIAVRLNPDGTNTVYAGIVGQHHFYRFDGGRACAGSNIRADYCTDWPDSGGLSRLVRDSQCDSASNFTQRIDIYPAGSVTDVHVHSCPGFGDGDCPRDFYGVGLDADNRVWFIGNGGSEPAPGIVVYDPATLTWVTYPTTGAFPDPYTYSDFSGYQRSAFTLRGRSEYYRDFGVNAPACPPATTPVWGDLNWTAVTVNSQINFYAQAAANPADLAAAPSVFIGSSTDPAPLYINDVLPPNLRSASYLRITSELLSLDGVTSAVLTSLDLDWQCFESE